MKAEVGLVGLGQMGEGLAIQLASKGIRVAMYNRTIEKLKDFVNRVKDERIIACYDLESFVKEIERPRKIILLIKAGEPVDQMINNLKDKLEKGDVIIDAGNSHFKDSERRYELLKKEGILFLGIGVSGGVEGARKGLSIMVGGDIEAYNACSNILDLISSNFDSKPAHHFFGKGGAGHFVKIVHNGIEYALIEQLAEIYFLLRCKGESNEEIAEIFESWKDLRSFLLDASVKILRTKEGDVFLLDLILDKAEQKGTGRWASESAFEMGVATPSINSAVISRTISGYKERRKLLSSIIKLKKAFSLDVEEQEIAKALLLANLSSYIQGLEMLKAARYYGYEINLKEAIRVWLGGSIIRSELLKRLFYEKLEDEIFTSRFIIDAVEENIHSLARLISIASNNLIPFLVSSSSYFYLVHMLSEKLPSNLTQALRDYFGAHGFERIDKRGEFHGPWL